MFFAFVECLKDRPDVFVHRVQCLGCWPDAFVASVECIKDRFDVFVHGGECLRDCPYAFCASVGCMACASIRACGRSVCVGM